MAAILSAVFGIDVEALPVVLEVSRVLGIPPKAAVSVLLMGLSVVLYLLNWILNKLKSDKPKSDTIILMGLCGAGKTSLFLQLRDGTVHSGTVTSMTVNEGRFPLHSEIEKNPKARPVHLVDVPGHPRLRMLAETYVPTANGVVFVVDAMDFMANLRSTAELLYEVLTNAAIVRNKVPVLLVANKMDRVSAHSLDFVRKQLEKEIDKLRTSRTAAVGTDAKQQKAAAAAAAVLGEVDEPFKFGQCSNGVTAVECSALTGKVAEVEAFIRERVKA